MKLKVTNVNDPTTARFWVGVLDDGEVVGECYSLHHNPLKMFSGSEREYRFNFDISSRQQKNLLKKISSGELSLDELIERYEQNYPGEHGGFWTL